MQRFLPGAIWNVPFVCEEVIALRCYAKHPGTEPPGHGLECGARGHTREGPWVCHGCPVAASGSPGHLAVPHTQGVCFSSRWDGLQVWKHPENSSHVPPMGSLCWPPPLAGGHPEAAEWGWGPHNPPLASSMHCDTRQVVHIGRLSEAGVRGVQKPPGSRVLQKSLGFLLASCLGGCGHTDSKGHPQWGLGSFIIWTWLYICSNTGAQRTDSGGLPTLVRCYGQWSCASSPEGALWSFCVSGVAG